MRILMLLILLSFHLIADNNLSKVSLQLKWKHQFQFAGFYIAKEKGFYQEVGLDVEIKEFENGVHVVNDVINRVSDFGVDDSQLIYYRLRNYPITLLLAIFQNSPLSIVTTQEHNITTLKAFQNKIVEFTDNQAYETTINTLFHSRGITVKKVPPSFGIEHLIAHKVDGILGYLSNEPYWLEKKGFKPVTFSPKDYGIEAYGDILFTSLDFAHMHPKIVAKFYQASKRGWEYAFEHIDESVKLIYQKYNTQSKTKDALLYEAKVLKELSGINNATFGRLESVRIEGIANSFSILFPDKYNLHLLDDFIYSFIPFSTQEKAYLSNKKVIRVCYTPSYYPIIAEQNDKPIGIAIDFLDEIAKITSWHYRYIPTPKWQEHLQLAQNKACDLVPAIIKSPNIYSSFLTPSDAIVEDYFVLVTKSDMPYTYNINELKNLKIGMLTGVESVKAYVKKLYPNIEFIDIFDQDSQKIIDGKIDAMITTLSRASYEVAKYPDQLKVMTRIDDHKLQGSLGINREDPLLLSIINKTLNAIPQTQKDAIISKYSINKIQIERVLDYSMLYITIGLALIIISIILFLYLQLQQRNLLIKKLNANLEERVQDTIQEMRKKDKILQQQSKLAQMGEMISMIAHQWRQPLSAISNIVINLHIKLLLQLNKQNNVEYCQLLDEKFKEINQLIQSLSITIDDFRSFYKPSKELQTTPIQEPIHKALNILGSSLEAKSITIQKHFTTNQPIALHSNELIQVILNIIKNAEDNFVEKKTAAPLITIHTFQKNDNLVITICDNGGGLDPEIIHAIFDPYFSTKSDQNGTGLGLYMSKIIIEDHHHGRLEVYNEKGGVCFKITLPT